MLLIVKTILSFTLIFFKFVFSYKKKLLFFNIIMNSLLIINRYKNIYKQLFLNDVIFNSTTKMPLFL